MTTTEKLLAQAEALARTQASVAASPTPAPQPSATLLATPAPSAAPEAEATPATEATPSVSAASQAPAPAPAALPPRADGVPDPSQITIVGDSVTLASTPALQSAFPGAYIRGEQNRRGSQAVELVSAADAAAGVRPYVVVGLPTNTTWRREWLDQLLGYLGSQRKLVLVNAYATQATHGWSLASNPVLADFAAAHPGQVYIADWYTAISAHTDLLGPDQVHPTTAGGTYYAQAVAEALRQAAAG